jgi:hypothetical protein
MDLSNKTLSELKELERVMTIEINKNNNPQKYQSKLWDDIQKTRAAIVNYNPTTATTATDLREIITQYNTSKRLNPAIITNMGDALSIQANKHAYCRPRVDNAECYHNYEVVIDGFIPDYLKGDISEWYELNVPLFACLECEKIIKYINERGGIYGSCDGLENAQKMASVVRDGKFSNQATATDLKSRVKFTPFADNNLEGQAMQLTDSEQVSLFGKVVFLDDMTLQSTKLGVKFTDSKGTRRIKWDDLASTINEGKQLKSRDDNTNFEVNEIWIDGSQTRYNTELNKWVNIEEYALKVLESENIKSVEVKRINSEVWTLYDKLNDEAEALIDAPYAQQYDFICQAPQDKWETVLQIIFEGADPEWWANKRESYDPNWQAKASKKAQKRKKAHKAYCVNGPSVYPLKKHKLNGTTVGLELAPAKSDLSLKKDAIFCKGCQTTYQTNDEGLCEPCYKKTLISCGGCKAYNPQCILCCLHSEIDKELNY